MVDSNQAGGGQGGDGDKKEGGMEAFAKAFLDSVLNLDGQKQRAADTTWDNHDDHNQDGNPSSKSIIGTTDVDDDKKPHKIYDSCYSQENCYLSAHGNDGSRFGCFRKHPGDPDYIPPCKIR